MTFVAGAACFAPSRTGFARPRALAVRSPSRALPRASALADDEMAFDLFTPEPELPPAPAAPRGRVRAPRASPLAAVRRALSRFVASVLATLLSTFFFGAQAFAATSSGSGVASAAGVLNPLVGGAVAAAGVSAAFIASRRMSAEKRALELAAAAERAAADAGPPVLDADGLLMASLRSRMLSLGADEPDNAAEGEIADDELDELERRVRDERSRYPVNSAADRGATAILEPPSDDGDDEPDEPADAAQPPAAGPKLADEASIALLEKLFNSGGDGIPRE